MTDLKNIEREFGKLSVIAPELNQASDALVATIECLDERLKSLNLGLEVMLPEDNMKTRLSYGKLGGKWGLIISRTTNGAVECWLFRDAPRGLRLYSVSKIEALLVEMVAVSTKMTTRMHERRNELESIVEAMK